MELTTIRELFKNREAYLDKEVTVGGWIRSIRDSKTFGFIVAIFAMTVIGIYYSISSNRIYASFSLLGFLIF